VDAEKPECNMVWWDAGEVKAYKPGKDKDQEAIDMINGPQGMARALFADGTHYAIPGLTNDALEELKSNQAGAVPPKHLIKPTAKGRAAPPKKGNHVKTAAVPPPPKKAKKAQPQAPTETDIDDLRATTRQILDAIGEQDNEGVFWNDKQSRFQIDYWFDNKDNQNCAKAAGEDDEQKETEVHKRLQKRTGKVLE